MLRILTLGILTATLAFAGEADTKLPAIVPQ